MSQQHFPTMNRKNMQKLAETLCKTGKHFNKNEVECLIRLFYTLVEGPSERNTKGGIDRNTFRNILHNTFGMTDDMIMDRVFRGFDKDNDSYVTVTEWIEGLSVFLRGTLDEKIKLIFSRGSTEPRVSTSTFQGFRGQQRAAVPHIAVTRASRAPQKQQQPPGHCYPSSLCSFRSPKLCQLPADRRERKYWIVLEFMI
ncbi:calaxin isoform X4 [Ascaphus truei]|uniref:calaxin isoform X4 n=1 Tax=Ascaphus truei TaxID=8439 RepID=UPI003F596BA0